MDSPPPSAPRRTPPRYDTRVEDALTGDVIIIGECFFCRRKERVNPHRLLAKGWTRREWLKHLEPKLKCSRCGRVGIMSLKYPHMLDAHELAALGGEDDLAAIIADGRGKLPVIILTGTEPQP